MKYLFSIILAVSLMIVVPGCSTDDPVQPEATSKSAPAKKRAAKKKEATDAKPAAEPSQPAVEKYSYSSAGKPDPFRPLIADSVTKLATDADRSRDRSFLTPLQRYELKDLKLVAVVVSGNEPTAMLEDPTGYGYVVRKGMLVGPNDGVVERVTHTGLIIREKIFNSLGEVEPRISTLTIQHVE